MITHQPVSLDAVQSARERIAGTAMRTPLVRFNQDAMDSEIYLKLENLQPVGSFKMRAAGNAILSAGRSKLAQGVWTASAGNMAQGVAWYAKQMGVPCTAVVPDDAPATKLAAIQALGGRIMKIPFADYQSIQREHRNPGIAGLLIHPFGDADAMAGNATIGLEIIEDIPDVDAVVIPYGGGGLSCGIASVLRTLKPRLKIYAAEAANAAPLAASLSAGRPVEVPYSASFVSGIGAPFVFREMWPLASQLLDGSLVVEIPEIARAVRLIAERNHVIAEGAGAVALAAALTGKAGRGKVVCILSGGNIDSDKLVQILGGE